MTRPVNREDYWREQRWNEEAEETVSPPSPSERRQLRLTVQLYGGICAYYEGDDTAKNGLSVPTCKRSSTSVGSPAREPDSLEQELTEPERAALPILFRLGVEDVERAVRLARGGGDRLTAIYQVMGRNEERVEKVLLLLERGEVSHALRLATCGQQSVQLKCPEPAGGCGHEDNYVPVHCGSRLCPDCSKRKVGQLIEEWTPAVRAMDNPSFATLTIKNVDDPAKGRDAICGAFGRLRQRTIPFEGSTTREGETKRWTWWRGTRPEHFEDGTDQWKVGLQEANAHDLARHLQKQYVEAEWTDVTGHHKGKAIPFKEVVAGGLYAVDVKQKGPEEFNVHLHVVLDVPYLPQAALSSVWEDLTGDPVVDIRRIYDRTGEGIQKALAETVAYATKSPEFESFEDAVDFVTEMKGKALVHPFGTLHGAAADPGGLLRCANCEITPAWWTYSGIVNERIDNMGQNWESDGDRPPPE